MKRKLCAVLVSLLFILALTGCQLAQENAGGAATDDRLAGIFLTMEYLDLFDFESYMNDHLRNAPDGEMTISDDARQYQGRLYAAQTTRLLTNEETGEQSEIADYVFPVDGIPYFSALVPQTEKRDAYFASTSDPAISDGQIHYDVTDNGQRITLSATVYVSPSNVLHTYYINPVYQSADGRIYAVSGSGFMVSTEAYSEGPVYSQTIDTSATTNENGKVITNSTSVTLSISVLYTPEKIILLQMDGDNAVLSQAEYAPDDMPATLAVNTKANYIIVETHKRDDKGQIKTYRAIYGSDTENIGTFFVREDGICVQQWTRLIWPE